MKQSLLIFAAGLCLVVAGCSTTHGRAGMLILDRSRFADLTKIGPVKYSEYIVDTNGVKRTITFEMQAFESDQAAAFKAGLEAAKQLRP